MTPNWAPAGRDATWDKQRQQIERHCALVTRAGHGVNQTPGNVADLEAFLREPGETPAHT